MTIWIIIAIVAFLIGTGIYNNKKAEREKRFDREMKEIENREVEPSDEPSTFHEAQDEPKKEEPVEKLSRIDRLDEKIKNLERKENELRKKIEREEMANGLTVEYLGGYPLWTKPCKANFSVKDSTIRLSNGNKNISLEKDMIVAISNEKSSHRNVGKTAAGAIVGGVLTGGIGLIVGGAIGAKKRDTSEMYITYKYESVELTMHLKAGKKTDKIYSWINSIYASKSN